MGKTLGINASHNGSVCVVEDGAVIFYVEEERLARIKRKEGAALSVKYALDTFGRCDAITYNGTRGYADQVEEIKIILAEHPASRSTPLRYVTHHEAHALAAAYTSPFCGQDTLIVVIDHSGETFTDSQDTGLICETLSIFLASGGDLKLFHKRLTTDQCYHPFVERMEASLVDYFRGSNIVVDSYPGIAQAYGSVCTYLGYHHFDAGKLMGYASYGKPTIPLFQRGHPDANLFVFSLPGYVGMANHAFPHSRLDDGSRQITPSTEPFYADLAASVQQETMNAVANIVGEWVAATGVRRVASIGGFALNSICNTHLTRALPYIELWPMPVAHDGGIAIGCAYAGMRALGNLSMPNQPPANLYWGSTYSEADVSTALQRFPHLYVQQIGDAPGVAAEMLSRSLTIAWHRGRSEAGPRALGGRSILSDPRRIDGRDHINRIKGREWFRPLAGTVLADHYAAWFIEDRVRPEYMMFVVTCRHPERIPAMVHVDGTCRVQTIVNLQNDSYHQLIAGFHDRTGIPLVLNTSFNAAGDPLCETPEDSIDAFQKMPGIDALFLEDYIITRTAKLP